jgi:lipid II:glycine glycyltransferase (peptidoglycan interpeptide bridge formation enzyme)
MTKILTLLDKELWVDYVKRSAAFDFYHTWYYHSMDNTAEPILFVYERDDVYIAFPLLKREIPNTEYFDLTCVYGYTGPISNQDFSAFDDSFLQEFELAFLDFLQQHKIVSVFSRLHPFFNQNQLMNRFAGIHPNGKTVAIDLKQSIEAQRSGYHRSYRQHIKQLKNKGYVVKETHAPEDVRAFAEIYTENMKRVGATDYYLFTEAYFNELLAAEEFESKLMLIMYDGEPVSGGVIICTNKIMQAHLVGTRTAHISVSPPKLLIDELTVMGRELGYEYLNLGGGLNFKEDTLYYWKTGFSNFSLDFNSWRYIVNKAVYDSLLADRGIDEQLDVDYFPLYRYHLLAE